MSTTMLKSAETSSPQFRSATQWLSLLRERKIGAVELLDLYVKQIEKHNPALNLVVTMDVERALEAARRADSISKSDLPPLHGLPMTVKETYEVVGMQATCGFPFLVGHMPQQDADPVARLKSSGAIVFGKTNAPTGAFDWQSYNPVYGVSNNPWNVERTPGGSSGGSAGALAAGFTTIELGSDMGGSIRVPAHFCGIYGHKPSVGIIPMRGHIPPMPGKFTRFELGVGGPMARSASDLELAMDILVAPGELEQRAWSVTLPASRHERLQDFRVALWADDTAYGVDEKCIEAIKSYAVDLRRLGVKVDKKARPAIDWKSSFETYMDASICLLGTGLPPDVVQQLIAKYGDAPSGEIGYPARLARALKMRHFEYFANIDARESLYRVWRDFFKNYDLVICPVTAVVAYEHDHRGDGSSDPLTGYDARSMIVNGRPRPYFDNIQWPSIAVVANLPATAVPTGRRIGGLPMGVQLIGPFLEDRTPLRFARLVERELGGFVPPPGYA